MAGIFIIVWILFFAPFALTPKQRAPLMEWNPIDEGVTSLPLSHKFVTHKEMDVAFGLAHLHEKDVIHRDLKPQNILIVKEDRLRAKISDMGISKRLADGKSRLDPNPTGHGTLAWRAHEQILGLGQTTAVDMFSFCLVAYYCFKQDKYLFGTRESHCETLILKKKPPFLNDDDCPGEGYDLISKLISHEPKERLTAVEVLRHPIFWDSLTRLSFLRDVSDKVHAEDKMKPSDLTIALGKVSMVGKSQPTQPMQWDTILNEPTLITHVGKKKKYDYTKPIDLLRLIRNMTNHFEDQPSNIKGLLGGSFPKGSDDYFRAKFP